MEGPEIKTVDGFHGREKEVVIVSFVRSTKSRDIGFLRDLRGFNESITRAKGSASKLPIKILFSLKIFLTT